MSALDVIRRIAVVFTASAGIVLVVFYGYRAFNNVWGFVLESFDHVATLHGQPWLAITISLTIVSVFSGLLLAMATITKPVGDETRLNNAMWAVGISVVVAVIVTGLITLVWWCWQHIVWNDELFADPWDGVYISSIWPFAITASVFGLLAYGMHVLRWGWDSAPDSQLTLEHDSEETEGDKIQT